jgi:hypothetical protein
MRTGIDVLVLNNYILYKERQPKFKDKKINKQILNFTLD